MYTLSTDKKLAALSALLEGNSIRSTYRMTGVDRNIRRTERYFTIPGVCRR